MSMDLAAVAPEPVGAAMGTAPADSLAALMARERAQVAAPGGTRDRAAAQDSAQAAAEARPATESAHRDSRRLDAGHSLDTWLEFPWIVSAPEGLNRLSVFRAKLISRINDTLARSFTCVALPGISAQLTATT